MDAIFSPSTFLDDSCFSILYKFRCSQSFTMPSPLPQLHAYSDSQDSQATGPCHHGVDDVIDQYLATAIPEQTSTHQLPSASRTMPKGHPLYTALQPAPSIVSHLYTSLLPGEAFPGPKLNEAI